MEPGDTETRGAEPNRSLSQSLLHGFCRCLPENLLQIERRQVHESGEVIKGIPGAPANGNDKDRIATEVFECDDLLVGGCCQEMFLKWCRVRCHPRELWRIHGDILEDQVPGLQHDRRGLPIVRLPGDKPDAVTEKIAETGRITKLREDRSP